MSDNNIVQFPGRPSTPADYDAGYDPFEDDEDSVGEPIEVVVYVVVDPPRERSPWLSWMGGFLFGSWLGG